MQRSQFEAEKKVAVADTSIQNIHRAIKQSDEEKIARANQLKELESSIIEKTKGVESRKIDLDQLHHHHNTTKEQILESQGILEELRQKLADENRKLDSKKNEHDLLKSLIDSMEGYPDSVKFLHNNKDWNHTAPILSDIIYVKEEFRPAVENVLEPYLNYYAVNVLSPPLS